MDINNEDFEWLMQSSATAENVAEEDVAKEKLEWDLFLKVLRSMFMSEPIFDGPVAFGVMKTEEDFQLLLRKLKALGYFFAIRTSRNKKQSVDKKILLKGPINIPIEHPYVVDRFVRLYCSSGREHNKNVRERLGIIGRCPIPGDCKATMTMRKVSIFSKVHVPTNRNRRLQILRALKQGLIEGTVSSDEEFWIWLSVPRVHNHPPSLVGRAIDSEVKAAMHRLIEGKSLTVEEAKDQLHALVQKEFARDPVKPASDNTAFFPTNKVIYNHLRHEGLRMTIERHPPDVKVLRTKAKQILHSLCVAVDQCNDPTILKKSSSLLKQFDQFLLASNQANQTIISD